MEEGLYASGVASGRRWPVRCGLLGVAREYCALAHIQYTRDITRELPGRERGSESRVNCHAGRCDSVRELPVVGV